MKPLFIILPILSLSLVCCEKGSGHAKPEEDAELFKVTPSAAEQAQLSTENQPLIPSPLDPDPPIESDYSTPEESPEDDIPILVRPNLTPLPSDTDTPAPADGPLPLPLDNLPEPKPLPKLTSIPESELTEPDYSNGTKRFNDVKRRATKPIEQALLEKGLYLGDPVFIRVLKEEKLVELFIQDRTTKTYKLAQHYTIAAMSGELGPKTKEGDLQAPEGFYFVPKRLLHPQSSYHLAFNIGYPNKHDRLHGWTGHSIMMHGSDVSIGCYAMSDPVIEEIYTICEAALSSGNQRYFRFHVFPFHMTAANMERHQENKNIDFWKNLKQGYDYFETHQTPPNVSVSNLKYTFSSP